MNNNSASCVRCHHVFSRIEMMLSCQGCDSRRCDHCETKCIKDGCSGTYCEVCFEKRIGNKFCHKCNTQCWICESIPYPPYPMETRHVKDMVVVICARHSSRSNEMKVFDNFLSELGKSASSINEQQLKADLRTLDCLFK